MQALGGRAPRYVGLTTGVFDLLHYGHLRYLAACREQCDSLVIGVDSDPIVRRHKGPCRPRQDAAARLHAVLAAGIGDFVFIKECAGDELLLTIRPHRYFVSAQRQLGQDRLHLLDRNGTELLSIPYTHGISTSMLVDQLSLPARSRITHINGGGS